MKKLIGMLFVLVLMCSVVIAPGANDTPAGNMEPNETGKGDNDVEDNKTGDGKPEGTGNGNETGQGTGDGEQTKQDTENKGDESELQIQNKVKAGNAEELKQMIQQKKQEMTQMKEGSAAKNQNQVRVAVHAFLAVEDLVGGIGPQVSKIAREFNNSVKETVQAEEKIQERSGFARFFAGGDHEAAQTMKQEAEQNEQKLQEMKQLMENCECGEEVKAVMQEQIQNMEQEQTRLKELAQKELKSKGMFGWIWK